MTNLEIVERDAISAAIVTCHGNLAMVAREVEKYGLSEALHGAGAARLTT